MRKRLFVGMLAASVLIGTSAFAADKIDFSTYSDEELQECYHDILEEYVNRGVGKTAKLTSGIYEVGKDIPAGHYSFYCVDGENPDEEYPTLGSYNNSDDARLGTMGDAIVYEGLRDTTVDSPCSFTIESGQFLRVNCVCHVVKSAGVVFE